MTKKCTKKVMKNKNTKKTSKVSKKNSFFDNKKVILISVIVLCLFLAIFSVSYALIATTATSPKRNFLKGAVYNVVFDDGSNFINLTNEGPESDEEGMLNDPYSFTLSNNGSTNIINKIYFSDITTTIPNNYLKIAIKVNDGEYSTPVTLEEFGEVIEEELLIGPEESVTYTIVLWVSSEMSNTDENGNSLMNTSYKSKITVETTATKK